MLTRWLALMRGLLRRRAIEREVEEELEFHLDREAARHESLGLAPAEARRLAAAQLGGTAVVRSNVSDVRTTWIEVLWREIRVGVRGLAGAPSFSVPALVVLALGIAGTTTILSVLDGVLFRPLPFPESDALVRVWSRNDDRRIPFLAVSPADFEDWRARAPRGLRLAAYERPVTIAPAEDDGEPLTVLRVSPDLFDLLGVAPAAGRGFEPADVRTPVVVVSHGFWQSRRGRGTDAVGQSLRIGRETARIVGVMPPSFEVANAAADVWLPLDTNVPVPERYAHTLRVVARTNGRANPDAVRRDLDVIAAQLSAERPADNAGWRVTVLPLFDTVVSPDLRRSLWITAGAVLFVLLLSATSVAGLVLVRSASRERELAVRVALGASRGSLARLLLLECVVLGAAAGGLGLLAAKWGVSLLRDTGDALIPRLNEVSVNWRVFGATAAVSLGAAFLAGVIPAWRSTRSLNERLRHRGLASDPSTGRTLPLLVVVELSTAVLLVVGAVLLLQTVRNLHARPLGFESAPLISLTTVRPPTLDDEQLIASVGRVLDRLTSVPGVAAAAAASALPFSGENSGNTFEIEGEPVADGALPDTDYRVVSPGYFATLGTPVLHGRMFADTDRSGGVVVISRTAAQRHWPERDPIGSRVRMGSSDWLTVVGIVDDVRYGGLADLDDSLRPMMYVPYWQRPQTPLAFVVRSGIAPTSLVDDLRTAWPSGQTLRLGRVEMMTGLVRQASAAQRFAMTLVAAFAGTAVALAVVALYGLLSLLVGRRTREIGVRLALGATSWDVARLIGARTLVLVVAGVGVGLLASSVLSRVIQSVLFGVSATDARIYAVVTLGFLGLAAVVSAMPIRRALEIDPVRIINAE